MSAASSSTAEAILLRNLCERLPRMLVINLAVAICAVIAFSGHVSPITLTFWFVVMGGALATRFKTWWDFQKVRGAPPPIAMWTRRFALSAGANGAAWGLASILLYDPQSIVAQTFLPFILAGLSGASLVGLSGCMPAFVAFFVSLTAPYVLRLMLEGDQLHLTMAAGLIVYMLGIGFLGRSVNAYLKTSVRLAVENERLVSALREKSHQFEQKSSQLEATFEHINQGVAVFDPDRRLIACNKRYRELHILPAQFHDEETNQARFLAIDPASTNASDTHDEQPALMRQSGGRLRFEQSGGDRVLEIERSPMPDGGFVSTSTDITERKQDETRIRHLAQHDPLTDLPNRLLFQDRLAQAFNPARQREESVAILSLDLNRFKEINDTFGHAAGDVILQQTAARIRACIREGDTLARLGGDEFAIIQSGTAQPEGAATLARRINGIFKRPFELDGCEVHVRASIGIALSSHHEMSAASELLRNADLALYRAKADARGGYRFFDEEMNIRLKTRQKLEHDLRQAVSNMRFELHYQPQLDLQTGRITGVEALLRWPHAEQGMISPAEFIPLAEETGLMVDIGKWVLSTACSQAVAWPSVTMAVNISPTELRQTDLAVTVRDVLHTTGLSPDRLELEMTEGVLLHDTNTAMNALRPLRDLGVRVALDNFGKGHTYLSHLLRFPFSKIKIDRSRVHKLGFAAEADAVARALIVLGRSAGMRSGAEGVETSEQVELLRQQGCEEIQGYHFGRPMLAKDMAHLVKGGKAMVA